MIKAFFAKYEYLGALIAALILIGMVSIHLINDSHIEAQRDKAVSDLSAYKLQQDNLVAQLKLENTNNMRAADKLLADSKATTAKQIEIIETNSNKKVKQITNEVRSNYEIKLSQLDIGTGIKFMRDTATGDSTTETKTTSDQQGLTRSEPITDTACIGLRAEKEQLEEVCALETIYFNQCRISLNADTTIYGREE